MAIAKFILVTLFIGSPAALAKGKKNCTYVLDKSTAEIGWTAFKTNERTGVNGSFKSVTIDGALSAKKLPDLLKGLTVTVDRASLETGNPQRNETLSKAFFAKLAAAPITGKFTNVDEVTKSLTLSLDFNGVKKDVAMTYAVKDDEMTATGSMDILQFAGQEALASLNKACLDLHKGKDGISKTWPDVALNFKGHVKSNCK